MSKSIFALLPIFFSIGTLCTENPSYQFSLRSKQFDCTYLFRHDSEKQQTIIDIRFDGNEARLLAKQLKSYEISEIITESTLIKEGSFESFICKTKQGQLFYIILKEEPVVQPIIVAPILEKLIPDIKNAEYSLDISSFAAGDEQLYLALSIKTATQHVLEQQEPLLFLCAFFINYNPKTGFLIAPLAVKKITQEQYVINNIQFDHDFKRLFCAGNPGLLCAHIESGTVEINHQQKTVHDIVIAEHSYFQKPTNNLVSLSFMTTSTALSYVILHNKTENNIKAFPISADHMLAAQDAIIDDIFYLDGIKHFLYRRLLGHVAPNEIKEDVYDPAVFVGATLNIAIIQKVKVYGDSIVILTEQTQAEGEKTSYCLYKSTALFHANGLIKDWTQWQLLQKTEEPIVDFEFDRIRGEFLLVHKERISCSGLEPKYHYKTPIRFDDASIASIHQQEKEVDFFAAISGNTLFFGPLETAFLDFESLSKKEIPASTIQKIHLCSDPLKQKLYCFITSNEGLIEVIIDNRGEITSIEKPIPSLTKVKKIIIDQEYLFILAEKALYRVKKNDISDGNIVDGGFFDIHLAENILDPLLESQCGTFLDMIVSDSFAILASTRGLWNIKSGCSLLHDTTVFFEKTNLPYHVGFPAKLYAFSKDGIASNVARYQGGNIQVLCVNYTLKRSQLYRFSVMPTEKRAVSEHTLQLFQDIILYQTNAPFINFGTLQQDCLFDGIRYLLLSSGKQIALSPAPRLGKIMSGNNLIPISITDFQNERILYTNINKQNTLVVVSEHGIYCYE